MSKLRKVKLIRFEYAELDTQPWDVWGDSGWEPDGDTYLLPKDEVTPFCGMEEVEGWEITGYTLISDFRQYWEWCGFSSKDVAYTTDEETAYLMFNDAKEARKW